MVFVKLANFLIFLLQVKQAKRISFTIFLNEKTPFQAIKTSSKTSRKIEIFPNGFGQKLAIFPFFFILGNICQENVFYHILKRKNAFLNYKTAPNLIFFLGGYSIVLLKNWPHFNVFIFGKIHQDTVFLNILERKNAFLCYKNKKMKQSKH